MSRRESLLRGPGRAGASDGGLVARAVELAGRGPEAVRSDPDVVALVRALRPVVAAPVQKGVRGPETGPGEEDTHDACAYR